MKINYDTYYWQNELVRLRPSTHEDWDEFYVNYFDSPARFLLDSLIELPLTEEGAKEVWGNFIENSKKEGRHNFTIETLEGLKVGSLGLVGIDERNGTFGIGMQISRDHRGKGYGTAAMKILLNYAFNERRLNKYQSFVIEGNVASETMLQKLGCVKEGVIRGTTFHQGRYWDEIHYGLFAKEFNALYKKPY
ncbi:GNAT family N-acetyltransferase [Alkaliphilus transvaalensis]|uniref:GNAT family N-acetyltransferase n=1 Tax=Alkaliphilus transvaalensis TaxID=114628 RepID=UPI00047EEF11|nr:GNAT family protein [Alkaliphilus transvaalensis]